MKSRAKQFFARAGSKNSVHLTRACSTAGIQTVELCFSNFLPCKDSSWDEPIGNKLKIFSQDIGTKEIFQVWKAIAILNWVQEGADHSKNHHVEKIASGVMTKLKSQQAGLAIDAEIKSEMIVEFVVKLYTLSNSWNPVF